MKPISVALFAAIAAGAIVQPFATAKADNFEERIIYSFCSKANCTDGKQPEAGLLAMKGGLFGTTEYGGSNTDCEYGCGTVFSVDATTGTEKVLYSFCKKKNCADGANPTTSMIAAQGILYGTTSVGGKNVSAICSMGCGTVYSLDPASGTESVLYSFCDQANCTDGASPEASLISMNGVLYGTTASGGNTGCGGYGCGTVFSIEPKTRTHKVLYSFCSQPNCADGQSPAASLVSAGESIYGMTASGGNAGCGSGNTCGIVFAVDLSSGSESTLYSFCSQPDCTDGALPFANLTNVRGRLYGTTTFGGVYSCQNQPPGCGTLFSLEPRTGKEKVLHSFACCNDGTFPGSGLTDMNGKLYGTTIAGGSGNTTGTAFALDIATGAERAIWSPCSNCGLPSSLIDVDGKLYGTMPNGGTGAGCSDSDCGTVFVLVKERRAAISDRPKR